MPPLLIDCLIVGAGPAGLCAASAARERGWEPRILERSDRIGGVWCRVEPDLRCLSPRSRDLLPDASFPQGPGLRASAAEVQAALEEFTQKQGFDIHFGVEALNLRAQADDDGLGQTLELTTSEGILRSRRLVLATGEFGCPWIPALPGSFDGPTAHSSQFRAVDAGESEHVVVVGAANSAVDLVGRLVRQGTRVTVAARSGLHIPRKLASEPLASLLWWASALPVAWLPASLRCGPVPTVDDDIVSAAAEGRVRVVGEAIRLRATGIVVEGDEEVAADRIVFATGFRRELDWVEGLTLDEAGVPLHDKGLSRELPGVGFLGLSCMRTRRSGFLRGFTEDARAIMRRLP